MYYIEDVCYDLMVGLTYHYDHSAAEPFNNQLSLNLITKWINDARVIRSLSRLNIVKRVRR